MRLLGLRRLPIATACMLFVACAKGPAGFTAPAPPSAPGASTAGAPAEPTSRLAAPADAAPPSPASSSSTSLTATPPAEVVVTPDGLLVAIHGAHIRTQLCREDAAHDVGAFSDPHQLVASADGKKVYWLTYEGINELDTASGMAHQLLRLGGRLTALASDVDALIAVDPTTGVYRLQGKSLAPSMVLKFPHGNYRKALVSQSYLWLDDGENLVRTDRTRLQPTPVQVAALRGAASWSVVVSEDAALVAEGGEASLFYGAPPRGARLPLTTAVGSVCVTGRTAYWVSAAATQLWRTTLGPALRALHTELVGEDVRIAALACAGTYVGWVSGDGERRKAAMAKVDAMGGGLKRCF